MKGGIYTFKCAGGCGAFEKFTWDSDIPKVSCPSCSGPTSQRLEDRPAHGSEYAVPYLSRAWGVMPEQIAEAKQNFPDHEFTPDGQMVIRSTRQLEQVRKDLGIE